MTEEKFTELVNLYLDKELSDRGLAELKAELAADAGRKAEFRERCRLHQAMRLALDPQAGRRRSAPRRSRASKPRRPRAAGASAPPSRRSSRGTGRSASRAPVSTRVDPYQAEHIAFPRWIMGGGLAACLIVGFVLLPPVFRDTTSTASQPALEGVEADELVEEDPLDGISRAELRRFASVQEQRNGNRRASLAAQLRLMGLSPEHTPEEKELRPVSVAAAQAPASLRSNADLLDEVRKITPMPAPQILRAEPLGGEPASRWPGGFESSLASFK